MYGLEDDTRIKHVLVGIEARGGLMAETSYAPRTGAIARVVPETPADGVADVLGAAQAAAAEVGSVAPAVRRDWLEAIARALEEHDDELVALADEETALGEPRLSGELVRAASQLRFYGAVAAEGSWLGATIETEPGLRRVARPLGPVAVFGASNFPFGFGVLGNDTASALAAGCPVIAKAHPAHVGLSVRLAEVATDALTAAEAPPGTLGLVVGMDAGAALVRADEIAAVGFTGSQRGGLALWRIANERERVIPVYAEMGTVNPVVMTTSAPVGEVAAGFVGSFTMGFGQYCTKPGLLLAPAGRGVPGAVAAALSAAAPQGWSLTAAIARDYAAGLGELLVNGAEKLVETPAQTSGWAGSPAVLRVDAAALKRGSRLLEECFGPVAVVAEYADAAELEAVVSELQGALAASVMSGGDSDPETAALVARLSEKVGRVAVNEWPTGVAWTWAQQHGGPWPATTAPATTSVGAAALERFVRPVTYQRVPDGALPPALQDANPWAIPRRVDGVVS